jgi:hypothetical protein
MIHSRNTLRALALLALLVLAGAAEARSECETTFWRNHATTRCR